MDRLEAMTLFVAAVEGGSLAAAARRHGRSPAAVTRAVALLEDRAQETLLLRSTRKLSLTAAGERHLTVWRDILERLNELEPHAANSVIHGRIVLTAPELFGRLIIMPMLERFLERHALVSARVLLLNRMVNLISEGVDLAIRLAPLPDSSLSAIRVGEVRTLLCASPAYLARAGAPPSPAALDRHACIGLDTAAEEERWPFAEPATGGRQRRSFRVRPQLSVDSAAVVIDAACRGRGIIQARSYQVADAIKAGQLVRLLPEWESPPTPVHLLFPHQRATKGAIRALLDHLVPELRRAFVSLQASIGVGPMGPRPSDRSYAVNDGPGR